MGEGGKRLLSEKFSEALHYAAELHARQARKGSGVPYVAHLLGVASAVLEAGGSEAEAVAALLHDAAEDQGGRETLEEIRQKFGAEVASVVESCSDSLEAKGEKKAPWKERKARYLRHLAEASPSALLVTAADKAYNAKSIARDLKKTPEVWSRFAASKPEVLGYYASLTQELLVQSKREPRMLPLVRELAASVEQMMEE